MYRKGYVPWLMAAAFLLAIALQAFAQVPMAGNVLPGRGIVPLYLGESIGTAVKVLGKPEDDRQTPIGRLVQWGLLGSNDQGIPNAHLWAIAKGGNRISIIGTDGGEGYEISGVTVGSIVTREIMQKLNETYGTPNLHDSFVVFWSGWGILIAPTPDGFVVVQIFVVPAAPQEDSGAGTT